VRRLSDAERVEQRPAAIIDIFNPKGWDNLARGTAPGMERGETQALKGRNRWPLSRPFGAKLTSHS
jgi:hypothetical protein